MTRLVSEPQTAPVAMYRCFVFQLFHNDDEAEPAPLQVIDRLSENTR
jgi:hypothetical protein